MSEKLHIRVVNTFILAEVEKAANESLFLRIRLAWSCLEGCLV